MAHLPTEATCIKCKRALPIDSFYLDTNIRRGHRASCYDCENEVARRRRERNATKARVVPEEKHCCKCNIQKSASEFYSAKSTYDGLSGYCISCTKADVIRWQKDNPKILKMHQKKYNSRNPERLSQMRERLAEWEATVGPEKKAELNKARTKRYRERHPDRCRERQRKRKYRLSDRTWEELCTFANRRCVYCGSEETLVPDHVIALTNCGPPGPENIVPACKSCNDSKTGRTLFEWIRELVNRGIQLRDMTPEASEHLSP